MFNFLKSEEQLENELREWFYDHLRQRGLDVEAYVLAHNAAGTEGLVLAAAECAGGQMQGHMLTGAPMNTPRGRDLVKAIDLCIAIGKKKNWHLSLARNGEATITKL